MPPPGPKIPGTCAFRRASGHWQADLPKGLCNTVTMTRLAAAALAP
jgi:hypothetical protein